MLQIVIYKKLNFWEEYTPLWRCVFVLELYFHFDMSYQGFPEAHQRFSENETWVLFGFHHHKKNIFAVAKNLRMGPFCLNDLPSGERVLGSSQTQDPPTPWYHPGASSQSPSPLSRICILPLLPIWSSAANLPLWCIRDVSLCSKHSYRGGMVTLKINFILTHQYQGIFANLFHSTDFAFLAPKVLCSHNGLKGIHCLYILLGKVRMLYLSKKVEAFITKRNIEDGAHGIHNKIFV